MPLAAAAAPFYFSSVPPSPIGPFILSFARGGGGPNEGEIGSAQWGAKSRARDYSIRVNLDARLGINLRRYGSIELGAGCKGS